MNRADLVALGIVAACTCFGAGWRAHELWGTPRTVHHEFAVPVGVDTTLYRYEFSGDCKVRRR